MTPVVTSFLFVFSPSNKQIFGLDTNFMSCANIPQSEMILCATNEITNPSGTSLFLRYGHISPITYPQLLRSCYVPDLTASVRILRSSGTVHSYGYLLPNLKYEAVCRFFSSSSFLPNIPNHVFPAGFINVKIDS